MHQIETFIIVLFAFLSLTTFCGALEVARRAYRHRRFRRFLAAKAAKEAAQ